MATLIRPFDNVKRSSLIYIPDRPSTYSARSSAQEHPVDRARRGDPAPALGRTRRLGVVDLAGELGLPKGTVHGLLRTLQHVGFVEQDEETGKYQLGAALLHMGSSYLDGNELRTRALNWSDSLAARTNESVRIGTLHEGQVLIVHHVFRPDDSLQTLDVGALLPAHASAPGQDPARPPSLRRGEVARSGLESFTPATITDPERSSASSSACASAAGRRTSASSSTARCRARRRSSTGAA
jgi:DNA-binding IclR family transcriptional regulator